MGKGPFSRKNCNIFCNLVAFSRFGRQIRGTGGPGGQRFGKGQAPAARKPAAEKAQPPRTENRRRGNPRPAEKAQPQSEQPRRTRAPQPEQPPRSARRSRAPQREEDPGLVLISRRPPQQKFTSFEEYMNAHGGATAPIEDYGGDE